MKVSRLIGEDTLTADQIEKVCPYLESFWALGGAYIKLQHSAYNLVNKIHAKEPENNFMVLKEDSRYFRHQIKEILVGAILYKDGSLMAEFKEFTDPFHALGNFYIMLDLNDSEDFKELVLRNGEFDEKVSNLFQFPDSVLLKILEEIK